MEYRLFLVERAIGSFFFVPHLYDLLNGSLTEEQRKNLSDYLSFAPFALFGIQYVFRRVDENSIPFPKEAEIWGVRSDLAKLMGDYFFIDSIFFKELSKDKIIMPL